MTFSDRLRIILRMHDLIKRNATGTQKAFARKLGLSRSAFFRNMEVLKDLGAPIAYCTHRQCKLYSNETLIDVSSINDNTWVLEDLSKVKIRITNNLTNPYITMTRLYFSTMNDESLYSNIKIQ